MRQIIVIVGICLMMIFQNSMSDRIFFRHGDFNGVILGYPYPINIERMETESWTPSFEEVLKADSLILESNFKRLGGYALDSFCATGCPVIALNWNNYLRQAYGVVKNNRDSIIVLSYIWDSDSMKYGDWKTEKIELLGACGTIWSASVDLKSSSASEIELPEVICYDLN